MSVSAYLHPWDVMPRLGAFGPQPPATAGAVPAALPHGLTPATPFECGLLWGKSRGLRAAYPLELHLLDAAAAARVIVTTVCSANQRQALTDGTGLSEARAVTLAALLAGWHDLGKATPTFQSLRPDLHARLTGTPSGTVHPADRVSHALAGYGHLVGRAAHDGSFTGTAVEESAHTLAQIVGGHHGEFPGPQAFDATGRLAASWDRKLGGVDGAMQQRWASTRESVIERVETVLCGGPFHAGLVPRVSPTAASLLTGIVITADWLMSQTEVIEPVLPLLPAKGEPLTQESLVTHHARAVARARQAVAQAGLTGAALATVPFAAQFPGYTARGAQVTASVDLPPLVRGPGIFVVMAPTGDGKTEAALHAASVMGEAAGSSGVLLALPTMATTDAMYARARTFARTGFAGPTRLSLLHSMASLNDEYVGTRVAAPNSITEDVSISTDEGAGCGGAADVTEWLAGSKKGMLAPNTVCTIDQVLAMAVKGKWQPLRLLGVSRKVVVVDEAHAYDAYMQALLRRALTWLAASGVPVVLLSATLSETLARSLVEAYTNGLPPDVRSKVQIPGVSYPGWVHVDATTGAATSGVVPATGREATLQVDLRAYDAGPRFDPSGLVATIEDAVRDIVTGAADGNVLVVCNTVREAVAAFDAVDALAEAHTIGGGERTPVRLMHSRFPAGERTAQAELVNILYGKDSRTDTGSGAPRPVRSVLIGTQVVEQSLDLDMDWVISDLAPAAMLIQRAGRGHRHLMYKPSPDSALIPAARPAQLTAPTLTVLVPVDADAGPVAVTGVLADRQRAPYDQVLLHRTRDGLLPFTGTGLDVPGDVQGLIDAVYASDFTQELSDVALSDCVVETMVDTQRRTNAAALAAIPAPGKLIGLEELTSSEDADEVLGRFHTRYDMNTVSVLPVWQSGQSLFLDADCTVPVPVPGVRRLPRSQIRSVIERSIAV